MPRNYVFTTILTNNCLTYNWGVVVVVKVNNEHGSNNAF